MAYGLQTYNTEGDLVIDSTNTNRINYQYYSSGTMTTGASSYTSTSSYYTKQYGSVVKTVSLLTNNNILFLRPKDYTGVVHFGGYMYVFDDGSGQLKTNIVVRSFPGAVEFEYIIFEKVSGKTDDLSLGDYGLHVYSEDGTTLLFSSNFLAARMRAVAGAGTVFSEETGGKFFASAGYKLTQMKRENVYNPGFSLDQEEYFEYMHKYDSTTQQLVLVNDVTFAQVIPTGSGITYNYGFTVYSASIIIDAAGFTIGT